MSVKYTKGPWRVASVARTLVIGAAEPMRIIANTESAWPLDVGIDAANARLIASAPDLYDQCDRILEEYGATGSVSRDRIVALQKIMAELSCKFKTKATGGAE